MVQTHRALLRAACAGSAARGPRGGGQLCKTAVCFSSAGFHAVVGRVLDTDTRRRSFDAGPSSGCCLPAGFGTAHPRRVTGGRPPGRDGAVLCRSCTPTLKSYLICCPEGPRGVSAQAKFGPFAFPRCQAWSCARHTDLDLASDHVGLQLDRLFAKGRVLPSQALITYDDQDVAHELRQLPFPCCTRRYFGEYCVSCIVGVSVKIFSDAFAETSSCPGRFSAFAFVLFHFFASLTCLSNISR